MSKQTKEIIKGVKDGIDKSLGHKNLTQSERLISIITGGCLLYGGIAKVFKKPKFSLLKVLGGGALILRGATGYCPMKQAMDPSENKVTIVEHRVVS